MIIITVSTFCINGFTAQLASYFARDRLLLRDSWQCVTTFSVFDKPSLFTATMRFYSYSVLFCTRVHGYHVQKHILKS